MALEIQENGETGTFYSNENFIGKSNSNILFW